jgi:hypothetical protein
MTLSIDIGIKHLAYSLFNDDMKLIDFGLLEVDLTKKGILERIKVIKNFLRSYPSVKRLIVEKQTSLNPVCFALMYSFPSIFSGETIITDPKIKFKKLKVKMGDVSKKHHKKQATSLVKEYLDKEQLNKFNTYGKKDDIADSILQAMVL